MATHGVTPDAGWHTPGMVDVTDSPRVVSSGEELVDVLQATYGITLEQARRQAALVEGGWVPG